MFVGNNLIVNVFHSVSSTILLKKIVTIHSHLRAIENKESNLSLISLSLFK